MKAGHSQSDADVRLQVWQLTHSRRNVSSYSHVKTPSGTNKNARAECDFSSLFTHTVNTSFTPVLNRNRQQGTRCLFWRQTVCYIIWSSSTRKSSKDDCLPKKHLLYCTCHRMHIAFLSSSVQVMRLHIQLSLCKPNCKINTDIEIC